MTADLTRREIELTDSTRETLILLAEGNPGALRVLIEMMQNKGDASFLDALHLDDMNIRGTQIWVAFKDFAKEDWPTFVKAIRARDAELIRVVNEEGARGNHPWKALPHGASQGNRPLLQSEPA